MLRRLILWKLDSVERQLGESLDYVRHILRVSLRAFLRFAKAISLAEYRRVLPAAPLHIARLVATRHADCGTCLQIGVNLALRDGVAAEHVRAAMEGRARDLPEDLAEAYHFSDAVVRATWNEAPWRECIRHRYGEEGLVELAIAIAACGIFPVTKRALGYAVSCSQTKVVV